MFGWLNAANENDIPSKPAGAQTPPAPKRKRKRNGLVGKNEAYPRSARYTSLAARHWALSELEKQIGYWYMLGVEYQGIPVTKTDLFSYFIFTHPLMRNANYEGVDKLTIGGICAEVFSKIAQNTPKDTPKEEQ
jgi:hypothetical protein